MILSVINLVLSTGVLVEPFGVANSRPRHHQVCLRAAMAPDEHFAIAWVDSLEVNPGSDPHEIYIRFFNPVGKPITQPYRIEKLVDTNWVYWLCLDMDSTSNAVLVWQEITDKLEDFSSLRFQRFGPDGVPIDTAKTLEQELLLHAWRPLGLGLAPGGKFAVTWSETQVGDLGRYSIYFRRYDIDGTPLDTAFVTHGDVKDSTFFFLYPQVALNDASDLVVTWLKSKMTAELFPMFQVYDAGNESVLGWAPVGHPVGDGNSEASASRSTPHWLDNDRFVIFWFDLPTNPIGSESMWGRVFDARGTAPGAVNEVIPNDLMTLASRGQDGFYCIDVSDNECFAFTQTRSHPDYEREMFWWDHQGGILGEITDNVPVRRTDIFEYSHPWGPDTIPSTVYGWPQYQPPAVAVCDERLVWTYTRFNPDTVLTAFATITDWDMVGVKDAHFPTSSSIMLKATLNRLSYEVPKEATLILYNSTGRRITEEVIHGKGEWKPAGLSSGVYFAKVESVDGSARVKVVVIR